MMNLLCNCQKPVQDGWSTQNQISKGKFDTMADEFGSLLFSKNIGQKMIMCTAQQSTNSHFGDIFLLSEKSDEAKAPINQRWVEEAINCDFFLKWVWQCCRYKTAVHRRFLPSGGFNLVKFSSILPSIIAKTWLLPSPYFFGKFLSLQHASLPGCK